MREVKFRVSAGDTTIGYEKLEKGCWWLQEVAVENWRHGTFDNRHYERWQYSGRKDKNNKEIYEGDIVRYGLSQLISTGLVVWDAEGTEFRIKRIHDESGLSWSSYGDDLRVAVIGNVYENPELVA